MVVEAGVVTDVVVAAVDTSDPAAQSLRVAVTRPYVPDLVLATVSRGDASATWPLFEGKTAVAGAASAFVCRGYACEAPTPDAAAAATQVEALSRPGS